MPALVAMLAELCLSALELANVEGAFSRECRINRSRFASSTSWLVEDVRDVAGSGPGEGVDSIRKPLSSRPFQNLLCIPCPASDGSCWGESAGSSAASGKSFRVFRPEGSMKEFFSKPPLEEGLRGISFACETR
jgi:hypothetical protein